MFLFRETNGVQRHLYDIDLVNNLLTKKVENIKKEWILEGVREGSSYKKDLPYRL